MLARNAILLTKSTKNEDLLVLIDWRDTQMASSHTGRYFYVLPRSFYAFLEESHVKHLNRANPTVAFITLNSSAEDVDLAINAAARMTASLSIEIWKVVPLI